MRTIGLTALATVLMSGLLVAALAPAPAARGADWAAELAAGTADGLLVDADGGVRLRGEPAAEAEAPYRVSGHFVGALQPLAGPAAAVQVTARTEPAPAGELWLEVRGQGADGRLSEWIEAPSGSTVSLPWPARAVQYRATLLAMAADAGPVLRGVELRPLAAAAGEVGALLVATPAPRAGAVGPATYRVYSTRIGLIGGRTANGHIIGPADQFAALPSRRALATKGGAEYQVRVAYKDRSIVVPVWDIGPWNVRDNYWETPARRDMWNDVPRGQPQAAAAYYDAYNAGRDGFGRRVLSPAGLDLSDGAFAALGMTQSDWVTVTLLWQAPGE